MNTYNIIKRMRDGLLRVAPVLVLGAILSLFASPPVSAVTTILPHKAMFNVIDDSSGASVRTATQANIAVYPGSQDTGLTFRLEPITQGPWAGVLPDSGILINVFDAPAASGAGDSEVDTVGAIAVLEIGVRFASHGDGNIGTTQTFWNRRDSVTIALSNVGSEEEWNSGTLPMTAYHVWRFAWHDAGSVTKGIPPALRGTKGKREVFARVIYKANAAIHAGAANDSSLVVYEEIVPFIYGSPPQRGY